MQAILPSSLPELTTGVTVYCIFDLFLNVNFNTLDLSGIIQIQLNLIIALVHG